MDYPKTLAAARAVENYQWALGDALNEECSRQGCTVGAAHKYLIDNGLDKSRFSVSYLTELRTIARNFPMETRKTVERGLAPSISWDAHRQAGKPEILEAAIKAYKPRGSTTPITPDQVREYRREQGTLPPRRPSPPSIMAPENEVRTIISQMLNWRGKWGEAKFYDAQAAHLRDLWVEASNTARMITNDFDPAFKPAVIDGGKSVA